MSLVSRVTHSILTVTAISITIGSNMISVGKCGSCEQCVCVWGGENFGLPIDKAHRFYNSLLLPHKPW